MKHLLSTIAVIFLLGIYAEAQTPYVEFDKQNIGVAESLTLEFEQGEKVYYLNYNDGSVKKTYILTDWQGSFENLPTVFNPSWSLNVTYSPCRKTITLNAGAAFTFVLDSNYNAYVELNE
tara:strand:- start:161 stop:520 length:360 start_codon:yes stop_codon:yes gene_type:complete